MKHHFLAGAAILVVSCGAPQSATTGSAVGDVPALTKPESDAIAAFGRKDYSLRGINRFTVVVPGVSGQYVELRAKYRIVVMDGTSDEIVKPGGQDFNSRAEKYSELYNIKMFQLMKCDRTRPMECRYGLK